MRFVMIAEIAIAVIIAVWTLRNPEAMSAVGTPQERNDYTRSQGSGAGGTENRSCRH